jgi:hypothetical protein
MTNQFAPLSRALDTPKAALAVLVLSALAAIPASAEQFTFTTPSNASAAGGPVSASATVTTGAGDVQITLNNLTSDMDDASQLLTQFAFQLGTTPTSLGATTTPTSAPLIDVDDNGNVTTNNDPLATWALTANGGSVLLDSLAGGATQAIIGPGPRPYLPPPNGDTNSSLDGNKGHNPFIDTTAKFDFAVGGVTADTAVTGATFLFGTQAETSVVGTLTPLPEPGTLWLVLAGFGLVGAGMRRSKKQVQR